MTKVPSGMPDTFEEKLQTSLELFLFGKQAHNKLNMKIGEHNLVKNADDQIGRCERLDGKFLTSGSRCHPGHPHLTLIVITTMRQ